MNAKDFRAYSLMGSALLCTMFAFASCDDDDKDGNGNNSMNLDVPNNPETGSMSSADQKAKLDQAGQALADQLNVSDLRYLSALNEHIEESLVNYESSEVTDRFQSLIEQMTTLGETTKSEYNNDGDYYSEHSTQYTTSNKQLIILSNFTGHFSAASGKWSYTKADDLQFNFKDQEGKDCTMTVKTSGGSKDVYYGDEEDWDWNSKFRDSTYLDPYGNTAHFYIYDYTTYINRTEQTIRVPENIEVTLKQGNTVKALYKVESDLSKLSEPDFDLSKDKFSGSSTLQVADYVFKLERVAFDGTQEASFAYSITKNNKTLFSWSTAVTGNVSQELLKTVKVVINIMDQVQIKGAILEGESFMKYIDKANENRHNETKFKSNVALANDLLNLGVYYDNSDVRQAKIVLESFKEESYWDEAWSYEPVFYFGDATSYSTFDAFFETGFDKLIAKFEKILDDLYNL